MPYFYREQPADKAVFTAIERFGHTLIGFLHLLFHISSSIQLPAPCRGSLQLSRVSDHDQDCRCLFNLRLVKGTLPEGLFPLRIINHNDTPRLKVHGGRCTCGKVKKSLDLVVKRSLPGSKKLMERRSVIACITSMEAPFRNRYRGLLKDYHMEKSCQIDKKLNGFLLEKLVLDAVNKGLVGASMIFSETPTVPQRLSRSPDSTRTLTLAVVPLPAVSTRTL